MKKTVFPTILLAVAVAFVGCQKEQVETKANPYEKCNTMAEYVEAVKQNDPQQYETLKRLYETSLDNMHIATQAVISLPKDTFHLGETIKGNFCFFAIVDGSNNVLSIDNEAINVENGIFSTQATTLGEKTLKGTIEVKRGIRTDNYQAQKSIVVIE